ncbi:hypothetical protein NDU88_004519 [Pleurodeles waltl]|uniref:Uncharacterized protein n=1 Tax=Pleurodeles waltl TaxID=8319 RepID=A0AAV7LR76_PLEWA|nr:hypothetical protein NDU88_004519 [Pleurodeles waltl]
MDMEDADIKLWTEADFEEKCIYIVNDHAKDTRAKATTVTQAESSLPRNLTIKYTDSFKERTRVFPKLGMPWPFTRHSARSATDFAASGISRHKTTANWGRGLAAIHDGRLRAELRMAAGHAAASLEALHGTPERSGGRHRSWRR